MIKKEEKQFAFVGCCIVCVFVAASLLTLAFCVGDVRASIDTYEFDSDGRVIFQKSISQTDSWTVGYDRVDTNSFSGSLIFYQIEYYSQNLNYIRVKVPTSSISLDGGAPLGAQTTFTLMDGETEIGSGIISYSKGITDTYVYYLFGSWDIGALSGSVELDIVCNAAEIYHISCNREGTYPAGATAPWLTVTSVYGFTMSADYKTQSGGYWKNVVDIDSLISGYYNLSCRRNFDSDIYYSSVNIWTNDHTYFEETDGSTDFSFLVFEEPIYLNFTDLWGICHIATFVGLPAENRLFGYVKDAAEDFVLENVFVEMTLPRENNTLNTTTSSTGYYNLNNDVFEEYWLNASLSDYQNFNKTIDYTGDQRYDIFLTKDETVNPGTCTVAGIVTNATSGEPILNALVWIKNTTFSSYRYTNANGYYVFYDLHNTTYTLSAEQDEYHKQQLDINLTDIDTAYYYNFALLAITEEEVPPTPTPKPPETLPEHVDDIFDMLGIEDWSVILASAVIMFMGGMFGAWSKYNPIVIMFGGFFGFLICIYMGLLPSWMLALVIVITVLLIVGVVARKYAGDE